jgi:kynurenine formamidase
MTKQIIDLSLAITNNMPAHKVFPRPVIIPHLTHEEVLKWGDGGDDDPISATTTYLSMIDHVGTHIDSFYHVNPDGLPIDKMDLDMFMGKAVCLDLTHIPDLGDIDVGELEKAEEKSGVKIDGHIVLMCTGFHKRHYPEDSAIFCNPGITADATHWLADHNSMLHGVEGPSTDKPSENLFPNHRACRDRGITHYEWLVNLEALVDKGEFQFQGFPLKIENGSASPVRALAFLD